MKNLKKIISVTAAAAIYGQAVKNATELAINEVNEDGGINGYQVEFKFEDDENDADGFAALADIAKKAFA